MFVGLRAGRLPVHERAAGPEEVFAEIAEGHDFIDAQLVVAACGCACRGVVPVDGEQRGCFAEVGCGEIGTVVVGETGQGELAAREHFVDVGETAEVLHELEVEKSAEEEKLSAYDVSLLLSGLGETVEVGQAEVGLADTVPCALPEGGAVAHMSGIGSIVGGEVADVHESALPSVML